MYLYLYQDKNQLNTEHEAYDQESSSEFRERLVRSALKDYVSRKSLDLTNSDLKQILIRREEKGKPHFILSGDCTEKSLPVQYSVSHSGSWWGCLMAEEPVGFDLEVHRNNVNYEKIARRYFTDEECQYIYLNGLEAFFEIWVRKEAFVKYLGTGLAEGLDSFSVIREGEFRNSVTSKEKVGTGSSFCYMNSFEIQDGVKSAYCSGSGSLIRQVIALE